ncbi:MAG: DUF4147 domain-containing protein, partial [Thermococcus sp.]
MIEELIREAIRAGDPYEALKEALHYREGRLAVLDQEFRAEGRVYVLAVGKASCRMTKAVFETLPRELVGDALIVTKHGYAMDCDGIEARIIEAGHPIPDENSLLAGKLGLELAERVGRDDILLTLISGGGSALFVYPAEGISLED